ncbi:MAG: 2-C-methyl-D-erythritol 4-phosphate cytidylyltransferase [Phycisphaerales bacterium]|nr:MAG: 2-C-methyl-D-erythritol 4-phosphate cytidylyltransferase [Phycisphaerales bacterium]
MSKFCVIIAAAGKAERFGGAEKKTFAKLDGRPVFLRSLEHFVTREDVCQTILTVAPEDAEAMKSKYGANLGFMGVKLAEGGERRCDTVGAALKVVSDEAEFVAVHDAARPCVRSELIDAVFAEAVKSGAAILAAPITGTIKRVGESMVVEATEPRRRLYEAQTPQVFRKDLLLDAYGRLDEKAKKEMTDDAQLVERAGHHVSVVESDPTNVKITTKADMTLAHAILRVRPSKPAPRLGAFEEAQW